ncbi:MAG TPA: hypothetical protein EYP10_03540 [Armatimonadetes bacterium]|nr:hypothetical protein [Armatimonadota bacterium]
MVVLNENELAIRAGSGVGFSLDGRHVRGERAVSNSAADAGISGQYAFCLRQSDPQSIPVYRVSYHSHSGKEIAARVEMPYRLHASVEFRSAHGFYGAPEVDPNSQTPMRMNNYRTAHEGHWRFFTTEGVSEQGFRISGNCKSYGWQEPNHWLCEVHIYDTRRHLVYEFEGREFEISAFGGQELPEEFLESARKLRELAGLLMADAETLYAPEIISD